MRSSAVIELPGVPALSILHEDRHWLAVDLPGGWLAEASRQTGHEGTARSEAGQELSELLRRVRGTSETSETSGARGDWRRSGYLRVVHRPEEGSDGIVLMALSAEASGRFERVAVDRQTVREYLAVIGGKPPRRTWSCCLKVRPDPSDRGRVLAHTTRGQHAETDFRVLGHGEGLALLLARPRTERPHQIRVHLAAAGLPVVGDARYGFGREIAGYGRRAHRLNDGRTGSAPRNEALALRAVGLGFRCPFRDEWVEIAAPCEWFLEQYGFSLEDGEEEEQAESAGTAERPSARSDEERS